MTSRLLHHHGQVKAIGPASRVTKCLQRVRRALEESISSSLISAGRVRDGYTDLRQALPEVPFLGGPGLPPRLQNLVGGERATGLQKCSSCPQRLVRGKGLLRHRLDAFGPIGKRTAQRVARSCLPRATLGIAVTISSGHTHSLARRTPSSTIRHTQALGLAVDRSEDALIVPLPDPSQRGKVER